MTDKGTLKLMAEDAVDLQIISAAIQDAVGKAGGLKYLARKRRFMICLLYTSPSPRDS